MVGKRIVVFSLLGLLALALALFGSTDTQAQSYKPSFTYTIATPTAGVASDSGNVIAIPAPNYNYEDSSLYTFSPIDGWTATGAAIAIADGVGTLDASVAVGLMGGPCSTPLPPFFNLENASVNTTDELSAADMYWLLKDAVKWPVPYAKYNALIPDYLEGYPYFVNQLLDPPGAAPPLVPRARYAGFTTVAGMNILIQFIVLNPGQLMSLGGIKAQMGPELGYPSLVVLNNPISQEEGPGAISDFCTPLSTTTTLYDVSEANPYTHTGGDTTARTNPPRSTGVLLTETQIARNYSQGERDADSDGVENDLDPCTYTADPGWDPRGLAAVQPGKDSDGDGLGDSCDPDINGNPGDPGLIDCNTLPTSTQLDCDGDGYDNRQDICPLVANGCRVASCSGAFPANFNPLWDNQDDFDSAQPSADLGPNPDSIGNACDDSDDDGKEDGGAVGTCNDGIDNGTVGGPDNLIDGNDPDCIASAANLWTGMDKGEIAHGNLPAAIWGANPGTGTYFHAMPWSAVCVGSPPADADSDGYCGGLETFLGSDPNVAAEKPESYVIDMPLAGVGSNPKPAAKVAQSCSDGVDNDLDGLYDGADPGCTCPSAKDADCDGVCDPGKTDPMCIQFNLDAKYNMELVTPPPTPPNPISGMWHELYPVFSQPWHLTSWVDNGDTVLSPSDQIDMTNEVTHEVVWFHVDVVTGPPESPTYIELTRKPLVPPNPISSVWHELFPVFSEMWHLTSWVDSGPGNGGYLGPSDVIDMTELETGDVHWFHVDAVTYVGGTPGYASVIDLTLRDNCPGIWNPEQTDTNNDGNGDACELDRDGDTTADYSDVCPRDPNNDADSDLICAGSGYLPPKIGDNDNCPATANQDQTNTDASLAAAGARMGPGTPPPIPPLVGDGLGDACDADADNDGFTDAVEGSLPTIVLDNCSGAPGPGGDAWPLDINVDKAVTVGGDVLPYRGKIGVAVPPAPKRLDLNNDNTITVGGDVLPFRGKIGYGCA